MKKAFLLLMFLFAVSIAVIGCEGDDGRDGVDGITGPTGMNGTDGNDGTSGVEELSATACAAGFDLQTAMDNAGVVTASCVQAGEAADGKNYICTYPNTIAAILADGTNGENCDLDEE